MNLIKLYFLLSLPILSVAQGALGLQGVCSDFFLRLAKSASPKRIINHIQTQQRLYWNDVYNTHGLRLFLVSKADPARFNRWVLLDPFVYPITLPPELLKWRLVPSAPTAIAASVGAGIALDNYSEERAMAFLRTKSKFDPEIRYLQMLKDKNLIDVDARDLLRILADYRGEISAWSDGKTKVVPARIQDLANHGLISVGTIEPIRKWIGYRSCGRNSEPPDSAFAGISDLLLLPQLRIAGHLDTELLTAASNDVSNAVATGASVFEDLYDLPARARISIMAETLNMELIEKNKNNWLALHPDEIEIPAYLNRAPVDIEYLDLPSSSAFRSEQDLRNVFLFDKRFEDIRQQAQSNGWGIKKIAALVVERDKLIKRLRDAVAIKNLQGERMVCHLSKRYKPIWFALLEGPFAAYQTKRTVQFSHAKVDDCTMKLAQNLISFFASSSNKSLAQLDTEYEELEMKIQSDLKACSRSKIACR